MATRLRQVAQASLLGVGCMMRSRIVTVLVWVVCGLAVILGLGGVTVLVFSPPAVEGLAAFTVQFVALSLAIVAMPIVGALVASRRPFHPFGWLLLTAGFALSAYASSAAFIPFVFDSLAGPLSETAFSLVPLFQQAMVALGLGAALLSCLVFPTGHLPSPRWRLAVWFLVVSFPLVLLVPALAPLISASVPMVAVALVTRFRGANYLERQQLKWLVYAAGLMLGSLIAGLVAMWAGLPLDVAIAFSDLFFLSLGFVPVAAGIAILRYRVFDIDLLINRTLVYTALTAVLAGLYSASVALSQRLFVAVTGARSDAEFVLATLVIAAAFTPIRNGLQRLVDRVIATELDPAKALGAFGEQVRLLSRFVNVEQLNVEGLLRELVEQAIRAYSADGGAVYLGSASEPRLVYASAGWTGEASLKVPLERQGEVVGLLQLGPRRNQLRYDPHDQSILQKAAGVVAPLMLPHTAESSPAESHRRGAKRKAA